MPLPPPRGVTVRVVYDPDPVARADALIAVLESAPQRDPMGPSATASIPAPDGSAPTKGPRPRPPQDPSAAIPTRTGAPDRVRVHPGWLVRPTAARESGYASSPAAANGTAESVDYPQMTGGNGDGVGAQS